MKKNAMMLIMVIMLALLTAACAKKSMENQSSIDQNQPIQSETQQETATPPEPEPALDTQAGAVDQDRSGQMAAHSQFLTEYVHFDFDSAVLRSDAMEVLRSKAQWLEDNGHVNLLVIEGHCDERGTEAYNLALGAKRADAVKQYMTDLGLADQRFQTQSYGEERPLDTAHHEQAWAKNRRAAFVIQD